MDYMRKTADKWKAGWWELWLSEGSERWKRVCLSMIIIHVNRNSCTNWPTVAVWGSKQHINSRRNACSNCRNHPSRIISNLNQSTWWHLPSTKFLTAVNRPTNSWQPARCSSKLRVQIDAVTGFNCSERATFAFQARAHCIGTWAATVCP